MLAATASTTAATSSNSRSSAWSGESVLAPRPRRSTAWTVKCGSRYGQQRTPSGVVGPASRPRGRGADRCRSARTRSRYRRGDRTRNNDESLSDVIGLSSATQLSQASNQSRRCGSQDAATRQNGSRCDATVARVPQNAAISACGMSPRCRSGTVGIGRTRAASLLGASRGGLLCANP